MRFSTTMEGLGVAFADAILDFDCLPACLGASFRSMSARYRWLAAIPYSLVIVPSAGRFSAQCCWRLLASLRARVQEPTRARPHIGRASYGED